MAPDIDTEPSESATAEVPADASRTAAVGTAAPTYLVTAYRWGCTNEHAYHVYAGLDRTKAIAMAHSENEGRGGKYGVVIWEFDGDGVDYKAIGYFGSSMEDETIKGPHHNHRIDYFERIGQFLDSASRGQALMPDPKRPNTVKYQDVPPLPDYLQNEVVRQREFLKVWEHADAKREEKAEGKTQ
jgi:hypothetical protein